MINEWIIYWLQWAILVGVVLSVAGFLVASALEFYVKKKPKKVKPPKQEIKH